MPIGFGACAYLHIMRCVHFSYFELGAFFIGGVRMLRVLKRINRWVEFSVGGIVTYTSEEFNGGVTSGISLYL